MDEAAVVVTALGAGVLAGSVAGARHPEIHPVEQRVFHAVNGLPDWLFAPIWLPMQLGNLVVGAGVGLGIAWLLGSWSTAVAVVVAVALKLLAERVVRRRMAAYLLVRQRPGTSIPGAIRRGRDVPVAGPSFPSGHVILMAAVTCVVYAELPSLWPVLPFVLTFFVMAGRVYVGAHNPLDVTAGLGAGMLVGGLLGLVLP
jgi:membrane-associated phospholipid phosphatase